MNSFFKGFFKGFKDFSHNITNIVNFVLLLIVYIFGVGPVSIIAKIFRKSFLSLKFEKVQSYWSDLNLKKKPIDEYYRQF